MKRMTENAISYYTVTPKDIKNIVAQGEGLYKYTPSTEFLEVIHDFKAALRVDWMQVAENIAHIIGASFSVLYPVNKTFIGDNGEIAYSYSANETNKQVNPSFFELDGEHFISWLSLTA